ncbi:mediator of RNA polymerase II transcription subunit 9 isoform X1 [Bubalus kerabau]|uniref:mediator of RNA polymerase II transcription subunit 9 isoform X1 n=1 Tax=Bubalus carabanensis TaxID=3119969 RepID=UPI00244EBD8C|nr:mediator of RNA polymerase II transcription subunit 9 isoform X1 [Bubalus carabanensis]
MASVGVAAGRQAEDTLPPPAEPPLPEMKPLPQPQPPPSVSAQQPQPAPKPPSPAGVKAEENCSFLPLVHSIIKWLGWGGSPGGRLCFPCAPASGRRAGVPAHLPVHRSICSMDKDSPDIHQDLNTLKAKFQEMRKVVSTMPGIHLSPEQQQQQLQRLREQVRTKNELLQKYKSLCMFEIPKE